MKTVNAPTELLDELTTGDVSLRDHRLALIDQILRSRDKYTGHEWGMVHLYYKCGLSQDDIAWVFGCCQQTVSRSLMRAREKALS
jgi:DNA-directed RNA polymerase specialized sigma24 family protein